VNKNKQIDNSGDYIDLKIDSVYNILLLTQYILGFIN